MYDGEDVREVFCRNCSSARFTKLYAERVEVETDKALALPTEDGEVKWFPKSQVHAAAMYDETVLLAVPKWLAEQNEIDTILNPSHMKE